MLVDPSDRAVYLPVANWLVSAPQCKSCLTSTSVYLYAIHEHFLDIFRTQSLASTHNSTVSGDTARSFAVLTNKLGAPHFKASGVERKL